MSLIIEVEKDGVVKVSIDGIVIGLVRSLTMHAEAEALPRVSIVMSSVRTASGELSTPDEVLLSQLQQVLERYKRALNAHPLIEVSDYHDTLPQGMPAVRPEK